MFKRISGILLVLLLCLSFVIGNASATLSIVKDASNTYIDYQKSGVSVFKIDDDAVIFGGRTTTGTVAGSAVTLGASYAYGEAIELRYTVSAWTLIGSSFKALYLRSEATLGGSYGLRCAEFYVVMNTSTTTGLSSLQNVYAEMLIKAGGTRTLTNGHCMEANISIENQTALTITNNIYCLYAKAQTGSGLADYTKINGIKIAGRDDGTARVFGNALDISDSEATVCTWTNAINISTSSATAINIAGPCTVAGISMNSATFAAGDNEIEMRNNVVGDKTIIASGAATDDAGIVTAVGADEDIADGSLYMSCTDGAGVLFIKKNDVWTAFTNP